MKMFDVYPLYDISIGRAEGAYVFDSMGRQYLDFYGGHAVISIGHTHPAYVEAITSQLKQIGFYSNSVVLPRQAELADKLGRLSGRDDYQLFLCNSGAEANENALKLASFHTDRDKIVTCSAAFHGRTSLSVAATDNQSIIAPVNRTDHVIFSPYNDVEALTELFEKRGGEIAAVIVEAIQGVGGIKMATDTFLKTIRSLCDRYGALMVADEIQCGCGRSGKYYSLDHSGLRADIYTMAKGIGNGFPIGAVAIAPHIAPRHGMLGTTFGGNPLACAAAIAVVDIMQNDSLITNAAAVGDYLMAELRRLPDIAEVRGRGLMIGIEMPDDCTALRSRLLHDEHIFVGASGKRVIRLLPPLNITRNHADIFLSAFKKLML
jgi:acetylornithine aminotransferase